MVRRLFLLFRQHIMRQPILIGLVAAAAIDNLRLLKRLAHGPVDMITFIEKGECVSVESAFIAVRANVGNERDEE